MMSQVQHVCHVTGFEQYTPGHVNKHQGNREPAEATYGGRGTDEHGSGLLGLWETLGDYDRIQITW